MGNSVLDALRASAPTGRLISLPRGHQDLHVMPVGAGYELRSDPDYDWNGRKRGQSPFSVIQHTISGAGNLRFENTDFRLRPGETMLTLVPHNHRYWVEQGGQWEFFWISLNGDEAMRIQRAILATAGPVLRLSEDTVDRLAHCVVRLLSSKTATPASASAVAYEVAMLLYDDVFGMQAGPPAETRAIQRTIRFIDDNLAGALTVDRLAEISGFSRSHFTRVFVQAEGMPPAEYVLLRRLRLSTRLLAGGDHSIKEVAGMTGFSDPNYFAKVFRRYFSVSPTDFRRLGLDASIMTLHAGGRDDVA